MKRGFAIKRYLLWGVCSLFSLGVPDSASAAAPRGWIKVSAGQQSSFVQLRIRSKYVICPVRVRPTKAGLYTKYRGKKYWRPLTKVERKRIRDADTKCLQLQVAIDRSLRSSSSTSSSTSAASSTPTNVGTPCALSLAATPLHSEILFGSSATATLTVTRSTGCTANSSPVVASAPTHGTLALNGDTVHYAPSPNFSGDDSAVISLSDANSIVASTRLTFRVGPPPQCIDGVDNDNDGFKDFPADPDCTTPNANEALAPGVTPKLTYAHTHWYYNRADPTNPNSPGLYPWNMEHPPITGRHIVYPYVLAPDYGTMTPEIAKRYVDQLPVGARSMFSWSVEFAVPNEGLGGFDPRDRCSGNSQNCPWMDNWRSVVQPRTEQFFRDYKAIGGQLDVYTADLEWLGFADRTTISQDPKFHQTNTSFPPNSILRGSMSSVMGDNRLLTNQGCGQYCDAYWLNFITDWGIAYINQGIYEPMRSHFPQVSASNFNFYHSDLPTYYTPSHTWAEQCVDGFYCSTGSHFGSAQQMGLAYDWGVVGAGTISLDGNNLYRNTPFNGMKWQTNWVKGAILAAPTVPVAPLIAGKRVYNGHTTTAPNPDYYSELVFHVLLSGAPYLNYWTETHYRPFDDYPLDAAIDEFDRLAGSGERTTLFREDSVWMQGILRSSKTAWKDDYVLTCMQTGAERKLCRFAPDEYLAGGGLPAVTIASSLISERSAAGQPEVTFLTRQKRLVFANATILRLSNSVSDRGYWITMPRHAAITITPSGLNTQPTAIINIYQTPIRNNEILVSAVGSFDPDGRIVRYSYDFNDDGIFDDAAISGDNVVPDVNLTPWGNPALFSYTYSAANVPPEGLHTVGLRVTDSNGAVTEVRSSQFVFFRPICPSPDGLFNGSVTCPLATGTMAP